MLAAIEDIVLKRSQRVAFLSMSDVFKRLPYSRFINVRSGFTDLLCK